MMIINPADAGEAAVEEHPIEHAAASAGHTHPAWRALITGPQTR
jgi:hypothetical protein